VERPGPELAVPPPSGARGPRVEAITVRARTRGLPWQIAAACLFAAAAATVLWQNHRTAALLDLSYVLENAWRIAAGDVLYRDFPLPHAPGTFVIQALVIKLFDASFMTHALYCALIGGLSAVVTLKILELQLEPHVGAFRPLALVLAAPLAVLNVYAIYPHPFYDPDACFFVLLALWALLQCRRRGYPRRLCFAAGVLLVVPIFVKQNIGLAFFTLAHLALLSLWLEETAGARAGWAWTVAGSVAAGAAALALIELTAGLDHYYEWTVAFPATRPRFHALSLLVEGYTHGSVWLCVVLALLGVVVMRRLAHRRGARIAAVALTAPLPLWIGAKSVQWNIIAGVPTANVVAFWPYVCTLSILVVLVLALEGTPLRFPLLLPVVLVGTAEASFLSQGIAGSTYGIFPLLVLLQGFLVAAVRGPWGAWALAVVGAAGLTIAGYGYVTTNARFFHAHAAGPELYASRYPRLKGMASSGESLADLDRLLEWVDENIPTSEPIMATPGEDPFFYALRRRPRMPVLMLEWTTLNPYSERELADFVRERGIVWVVHKTKQQCCAAMVNAKGLLPLVLPSFHLVHEVGPYRIYRRNGPPSADAPPGRAERD
jgi:hypothetical protein